MIDWHGILAVFAAFFVVAASPGPATLALATVSAASGRRSGTIFGAGLAIGLGFWGLVAATGLGAILQSTGVLLTGLKIAGGLYLLWLAYGSARSAWRPSQVERDPMLPQKDNWFWRGLVLNLSNPKAVFAWMAALSVGLGGDDGILGLGIATVGCALIGLIIYAVYAVAFSFQPVMRGYAEFKCWIEGVTAALFVVAGLALIRSALTRSAAPP
ncbi:LysE family translocator [Sulfitobacter delicatus]|uniref:Threonine/homoserine/homoserine lactone efflux protein n=1 Tax=Sulfitobacter delicatus TaxID=218672 RepID=A0A1G7SZS9_9RHOB|nr:LysE family transporter [Sulfitobacter delicatus]SDG28606.1 Threonine/homoserine/homoserine lactone efflux protein [Sulfitobacter delicatus]